MGKDKPTFRTATKCLLRKKYATDSDQNGFIEAGIDMVSVGSKADKETGAVRVQFKQGWLSVASKAGNTILEPTNMAAHLVLLQLESIAGKIQDLGIDEMSDLALLDDDDLKKLNKKMSKKERVRFDEVRATRATPRRDPTSVCVPRPRVSACSRWRVSPAGSTVWRHAENQLSQPLCLCSSY